MNILNGADSVLYNFNRNQLDLEKTASRLSSGLRIQSAADDPSGLAISENLRSRVGGLQQSVENVQSGTNMLTVADGAAASIQQILQRINSLIVESNSDINSDEQLQNIQTEIDAMLHEINTISSNADFHGTKLFDGSHDTYVAPKNANVSFQVINPGLMPNGTIPTGTNVSNPLAPVAALISKDPNYAIEYSGQPFVSGLMVFQVTAAGNNLNDPLLGPVAGPGVELNQILYSSDVAFANGKGSESIFYNVIASGSANDGNGPGNPVNEPLPNGTQAITFDLPNLSAADVGVAMGVEIVAPKQSGGGTALNINDGGQEGSTIAISLPTLSSFALQVSNISVLRPTQVDDQFGTGAATGVDSSNQWAAMDAQIKVGNAIDAVSSLRAQLGAQMVSTQQDANNDNVNIVNLTASESSIRDLDIGQATTEFTRDQIMTQVGTSVLSQYQVDARQLASLMINALVA
jgi:flagellin